MTYSLDSIAHLDHSKAFAQLNSKFNSFNPLKVLRIEQFEIRHSNVLAWLLDPSENHNLGDFFVKKVLSRIFTRAENEERILDESIDYVNYHFASYSDLEVLREVRTTTGRYIDLVAKSDDQKTVFIIENKFHAGESEGQLEDYISYISTLYEEKGYTIIPIFLTLNNVAPSNEKYWVLDYSDLLDIIQVQLTLNRESIADRVYDFLTYYVSIIKEELVEDNEAIGLALNVYKTNQHAIDLLYATHHDELRKHHRYNELFRQLDSIEDETRAALKRIYVKQKQTIDYVYRIGSNVLRQAFLTFANNEDFPEEAYQADSRLPSFILPDWVEFKEVIGEPTFSYWLGHGLVVWYERTWDERLKLTIEVGPLPFEKRLPFLHALEQHGIRIRPTAKMEGKKFTRIHSQTVEIADWVNKEQVLRGIDELYHSDETRRILKSIALAVESLLLDVQETVELKRESNIESSLIPSQAFNQFVEHYNDQILKYRYTSRHCTFVLHTFEKLEATYGKPRENWWLNHMLMFWFERLNDDRLKITLELGPLEPEKRISFLEQIEAKGINVASRSKLPSAKYTRLYSIAKVVNNWTDKNEVYNLMDHLYKHEKNQLVLRILDELVI
ncbi:PD-(D/E)XK nuclease family protein [Pseudalkalibacillus hwajinpoensis]|uniref:PD-(D/E)XK nuclease family protein n=1 Tax=Guptibacillus hwajinpoensis TaxID=208199 RepID=A0A4U1MN43_9BACL|nr:PD-(D/E)XK nuclease family protein [Pseudalkalibacillus hwajinpoensis]TKD72214.1 hypothetical protein FBF83_05310 [Pseudalkalibacillus hwajinpoensis]